MCEVNKEPDFEVPSQEEEEDDDDLHLQPQESINFSHLHLDGFKNNHHQNHHPCTTCASNATASNNPMKRPSPEQISEPKSKKPSLDNNHPYTLSGFSKLPLPQLQRSVSDPYTPTKANLSEYAKAADTTF
ncbi:hypothetical protein PTKIN_Ptkin01aG0360900 [Pterospermum kingtungense]